MFRQIRAKQKAVIPAGWASARDGRNPDRSGPRRPRVSQETMVTTQHPSATSETVPAPAFAGVTRENVRGDGRGVKNAFEPYSY